MLFGTKSVFVTCATALMLVSTTLVAVDAKPQPLNEGGVPGLKIDPNNPYFGTLETLSGFKRVGIQCYPDKPIPELEQSLIYTPHPYQLFYKSCDTLRTPNVQDQNSMQSILCPLASYKGKDGKRCYATELLADGAQQFYKPLSSVPDGSLASMQDKIETQLINAHNMASRLGWYLSWNLNDVYINAKGELRFNPLRYIMDKKFKVPILKGTTPLDGPTKLKRHDDYMHVFLYRFIHLCFPGEAVPLRLVQLIEQLPKLPLEVETYNAPTFAAQAA